MTQSPDIESRTAKYGVRYPMFKKLRYSSFTVYHSCSPNYLCNPTTHDMIATESLLEITEVHIRAFFNAHVPAKYVFHDLEHTIQIVAASRLIGQGFNLDPRDQLLVELATWFHDTGYSEGPEAHEERSCRNAADFLQDKISPAELETVIGCIRATKVPQNPANLLERIICDADLSHLGTENYWDRTGKFRQELILTRQLIMSEQEWVEFELNFMLGHEYHTQIAQELFNKKKAKHIQQLVKQKRRLNPEKAPSAEELALLDDKEKTGNLDKAMRELEREQKKDNMGRGVETMYRTTYRTHTNLSAMADNKANLMLSVNAIVISIIVSNAAEWFEFMQKEPRFIIPALMLTATCLTSMVYATLSTRPKVTEGKVTREAIVQRRANLLFFGNFYNMELDEFQWGVNEMLRDPEFLYSSMSRDLYFLGIVLGKKYRYLSICYNVFMFGIIASVAAFGIAFAF
jgi:predicted metal-dependent HD superfamily phosphohydrolase